MCVDTNTSVHMCVHVFMCVYEYSRVVDMCIYKEMHVNVYECTCFVYVCTHVYHCCMHNGVICIFMTMCA